MIVTIDGPAGVGKSSVAKLLAEKLGFAYLDTGAMYRAVTWAVLERGVDPNDEEHVARIAAEISIDFDGSLVLVDGQDVTNAIRRDDVTGNVSPVADNREVRSRLVDLQREIAEKGDVICEGRDQGTVVFPDAICKIFLTASAEERAARRTRQLREQGSMTDYEQILREQNERDQRDYSRPVGRLQKAEDAIEVITDQNTIEEVTILLFDVIRNRIAEQPLQQS